MRAAGIIAEYNPFHNGHSRHIRETRERTQCDCVIVAMNGSISQRGEMMILDKWARAEMALRSGADLVLELPALWGIRPAEHFAQGGVALLQAIGCKWLSFGCETEDMALLTDIVDFLEEEPPKYTAVLRSLLSEGKSFARARGEAIASILNVKAELIAAPNCTLALEYLRAIRRFGNTMQPIAVLRGVSHHAREIAVETSASAIRRALQKGEIDAVEQAVPAEAFAILRDHIGMMPDESACDIAQLMALRAMDRRELASLPDVTEGLENRIWDACRIAGTRERMLELCKSKRYTVARLSRIAAHALLRTNRDLLLKYPLPTYARLLGARKNALGMLAQIQKDSTLPIVDRARALRNDESFHVDCRATDARALVSRDPTCRNSDTDFTHRLVVVE